MSQSTSIYGGRAALTFHPEKHYYTVSVPGLCSNLFQPSVTSVLAMKDKSGALVHWAVASMSERAKELLRTLKPGELSHDMCDVLIDAAQDSWRQKRQDAADAGSLAHRVLHKVLLGGARPKLPITPDLLLAPELTPDIVDAANNAIDAGLRFVDEHRIRVIQAESPRWSPTHGYVGTGDLIAEVDGKNSVLDWKTGKRIYPEYFLQTASYQKAYEEEFPHNKLAQRLIVNIGRDGKLATETRDNSTLEDDFQTFLALLQVWRWDQSNRGAYSKQPPRIVGPLAPPKSTTGGN